MSRNWYMPHYSDFNIVLFWFVIELKIFKMAAAKRGRFVMEMFISGRKHETSYFGLLEYGVFKFYEKNMFRP